MTAVYRSAAGARAVQEQYRELLARWPVPSEQVRVPTREGETFVVACGPPDAPPVLLLHGSATNSASWLGDAPAWSEHLRLYAVDLIGEPGLSAPSRPALGSEAYAGWLDDVLDALGVGRVSIVGLSLGGWLALDYATRRPERVDRLALLCPSGIGRRKWGVLVPALLLLLLGRWGQRRAQRLILGTTPPRTALADAFGALTALVTRHFKPRLAVPAFDDGTLRRLAAPTLVVVGGRDRLLDSAGTRRRLARTAPHATVRLLPDAGHLLLGQTGPVLDFLRAADRTRA